MGHGSGDLDAGEAAFDLFHADVAFFLVAAVVGDVESVFVGVLAEGAF